MLWQFEKPIVREFMHLALPTVLAPIVKLRKEELA